MDGDEDGYVFAPTAFYRDSLYDALVISGDETGRPSPTVQSNLVGSRHAKDFIKVTDSQDQNPASEDASGRLLDMEYLFDFNTGSRDTCWVDNPSFSEYDHHAYVSADIPRRAYEDRYVEECLRDDASRVDSDAAGDVCETLFTLSFQKLCSLSCQKLFSLSCQKLFSCPVRG